MYLRKTTTGKKAGISPGRIVATWAGRLQSLQLWHECLRKCLRYKVQRSSPELAKIRKLGLKLWPLDLIY